MKLLQVWGSIEKRHVTAITIIYECLYAVACRVHLLDGAMVSPTKDVYSVFGLTFYSRYPSGALSLTWIQLNATILQTHS